MMISSIVAAVLLTSVIVGGLPGLPPGAPGRMVFVVSFAIITGVLVGLFWHWFIGSWFREYFRLDREYRPIDGDGEVNLDTAEEQFRFYHVINLLLLPLGVIYLVLVAVHYAQGTCSSAWECLEQVSFPGWWFFIIVALGAVVERIEKNMIRRRGPRPPAAS
jgi:hypothetical protein